MIKYFFRDTYSLFDICITIMFVRLWADERYITAIVLCFILFFISGTISGELNKK